MRRRRFVVDAVLAFLGLGLMNVSGKVSGAASRDGGSGFFTSEKRGGRWWLIDPDGKPFWSIGINHVDPATLRQPGGDDVWSHKYENSMECWLDAVRTDLETWGFNTLGWNQEVVTHSDQMRRHSRSFTFEEYQWLGMPYCHLLPFIESHQWEIETRLPDIRSSGFADWCDYVARDECGRMKNEPNLIGYFFTDCPTWIHTGEDGEWKGSLFDPELLNTEAGCRELRELADAYYRVTTESIRRYDPNHLVLGDRYEANRPIAEEVVKAALPYVDVFSFQCFGDAAHVAESLERWAGFTGKPVLVADSAPWLPHTAGWPPKEDRHVDPAEYAIILDGLKSIPSCVGFHLCGAYLRNNVRRYGLKDSNDQLDVSTPSLQEANMGMQDWLREKSSELD